MTYIVAFNGNDHEFKQCCEFIRDNYPDMEVYHSNLSVTTAIIADGIIDNLFKTSFNHWQQGMLIYADKKVNVLKSRIFIIAATATTYINIPILIKSHSVKHINCITVISEHNINLVPYDLYMCDYITFLKVTLFWKRISSMYDTEWHAQKFNRYIMQSANNLHVEQLCWLHWLDQISVKIESVDIVGNFI